MTAKTLRVGIMPYEEMKSRTLHTLERYGIVSLKEAQTGGAISLKTARRGGRAPLKPVLTADAIGLKLSF